MSEIQADIERTEHDDNTDCEKCRAEAFVLYSNLIVTIKEIYNYYSTYYQPNKSRTVKKLLDSYAFARKITNDYLRVLNHNKFKEFNEDSIDEIILDSARTIGCPIDDFYFHLVPNSSPYYEDYEGLESSCVE
jgi:hypothetical protein